MKSERISTMRLALRIALAFVLLTAAGLALAYLYLPVNRVAITSELVMLGDLNNDNQWNLKDAETLSDVLADPFRSDRRMMLKIDVNRNDLIDEEDVSFLRHLYQFSDPYLAEQKAGERGVYFPRPREFFKYLPTYEYVQRPLFALHPVARMSPFAFLPAMSSESADTPYEKQLLIEIYNEALRFSSAYTVRKDQLDAIESDYAQGKIRHCNNLFDAGQYYPLLLNLISLVEDAETLSIADQSEFIRKILYFRDHLKALLLSDEFAQFKQSRIPYTVIYQRIEAALKADLDLSVDLASLAPPRDFTNLQNYLDRAEWQAYKSKTRKEDFRQLVLYAQYDRRYLRAVSNTSPKQQDTQLQNHNLPMILLFREALRISGNDKKAAVALLDEAIRIPLGWVKRIPTDLLPNSIALENFLLPGNKEDGLDKSRHWNVFGGIAIYKSPQEALMLALKRENLDLQEQNFAPEAMQEFIRDTIANINGIYYVISIDSEHIPGLEGL